MAKLGSVNLNLREIRLEPPSLGTTKRALDGSLVTSHIATQEHDEYWVLVFHQLAHTDWQTIESMRQARDTYDFTPKGSEPTYKTRFAAKAFSKVSRDMGSDTVSGEITLIVRIQD